MARVYLETSFFSACVTTRSDDKSRGWRASSREWWQVQGPRHERLVSDEVLNELSSPDFPNGSQALAMLRGLGVLETTPEATALAELFVAERVMPAPALSGDALHVALATIHRVDYLLTWNVRHLANPNKRVHLAVTCARLALVPPQIVTPDMLQEADDG